MIIMMYLKKGATKHILPIILRVQFINRSWKERGELYVWTAIHHSKSTSTKAIACTVTGSKFPQVCIKVIALPLLLTVLGIIRDFPAHTFNEGCMVDFSARTSHYFSTARHKEVKRVSGGRLSILSLLMIAQHVECLQVLGELSEEDRLAKLVNEFAFNRTGHIVSHCELRAILLGETSLLHLLQVLIVCHAHKWHIR